MKISEDRWVSFADPVLETFPLNLLHGICQSCLKILYPEEAGLVLQNGL